jgi:hypothetical protein
LLCREVERTREQTHFWEDIQKSVIQLVNCWYGWEESEPDPEVVDRMMRFVKYAMLHQQPGTLLVSGDDDRDKAFELWQMHSVQPKGELAWKILGGWRTLRLLGGTLAVVLLYLIGVWRLAIFVTDTWL